MTAQSMEFRENLLWPASIVIGLLLHTILASVLWQICNSAEDMKTPILRVMRIAPAPPAIETPDMPVEVPAETAVETPPEPVIEQPTVEPEVLPAVVKARVEPVRPKSEPVKKTAKPETRIKKAITPAVVEAKPEAATVQSRQPAPTLAAPLPAAHQPTPAAATKPVAPADTKPVAASGQNFDRYLQKIYRQLERNKEYPGNARRRGITGKVAVAFSISSEGKATKAAVTSKSPAELADAALKLVNSQRFERPPEGWNSTSRVEMQISYSLR